MDGKPGFGIVVDHFNRAKRRTPRNLLLQTLAVAAALRGTGLRLAFTDETIERDGDRWVPYNDRPVSLIGALVIVHRVRVAHDDEFPSEGAARLLGVSPIWICGLDEGWKMDLKTVQARGAECVADYAAGFELGAEMRFLATHVCRACGLRNMLGSVCPCGAKS